MGKEDKKKMSPIVKSKLDELKERAEARRNRPGMRSKMTEKQRKTYAQNAKDMMQAQYETLD